MWTSKALKEICWPLPRSLSGEDFLMTSRVLETLIKLQESEEEEEC